MAIRGHRVYLPKRGWVTFFPSRPLPGVLKNTTVRRHGFVIFQTEQDVADPFPRHPADAVGGVVGVRHFLVLSDGTISDAPRAASGHLRQQLPRVQVTVARPVTFSQHGQKTRRGLHALYARVADLRRDFVHNLRPTVRPHHATGALEALRLGHGPGHGGPAGDPGASAGRLNRAILERGWGRFVRLLDDKLAAQGGQLVLGPATDSSQECPQCGHTAAETIDHRGRQYLGVPRRWYPAPGGGLWRNRALAAR